MLLSRVDRRLLHGLCRSQGSQALSGPGRITRTPNAPWRGGCPLPVLELLSRELADSPVKSLPYFAATCCALLAGYAVS